MENFVKDLFISTEKTKQQKLAPAEGVSIDYLIKKYQLTLEDIIESACVNLIKGRIPATRI